MISPGNFADAPIVEKSVPVAKDFEVRAIYLTGLMAGSDHGIRIIKRWREVGGNAVVFDIKDSDGTVNIPFEQSAAGRHHTTSFPICQSLYDFCIRRACTPLRAWRFSGMNGWW